MVRFLDPEIVNMVDRSYIAEVNKVMKMDKAETGKDKEAVQGVSGKAKDGVKYFFLRG